MSVAGVDVKSMLVSLSGAAHADMDSLAQLEGMPGIGDGAVRVVWSSRKLSTLPS
jgi:hypothetical protein